MATLRGSPPCTELLGGNRRNKKPRFTLPVNLTGAWYLNESKRVFFPCGAVEDHRHFRGSGSQFERSALSPRKLRDRPEMARSSGQRLAASLREMIFRCVAKTKVIHPAGAKSPHSVHRSRSDNIYPQLPTSGIPSALNGKVSSC